MWSWEAPYLKSEHGYVLRTEIKHGSTNADYENANVGAYPKDGKRWQKWHLVYVEDMPREPRNGEMNPDYGLIVGKHFYLVSSVKSGKVLDLQHGGSGRQVVVKGRTRRNSQKWYFDQNSLTIKNVQRGWSIS